mgnify:CR=1 FL=1
MLPTLDNATAHRRLEDLGWDDVREYQAWHGLKPDGDLGAVTARSLGGLRICPGIERMAVGGRVCKWGKHKLSWNFAGRLPGLNEDQVKAAIDLAASYWSAVCDLAFEWTANPRSADLPLSAGAIDHAGGTLAWQELPCGSDTPRRGRYDTRETWENAISPSRGRIDLVRVAAHEIGHGIGIPHLAAGNLLQPTYDTRIRKPQAGDIREAQRRYGPPKSKPDPADDPKLDPNADEQTILEWLAQFVHIPAREGDLIGIGGIPSEGIASRSIDDVVDDIRRNQGG